MELYDVIVYDRENEVEVLHRDLMSWAAVAAAQNYVGGYECKIVRVPDDATYTVAFRQGRRRQELRGMDYDLAFTLKRIWNAEGPHGSSARLFREVAGATKKAQKTA